MNLFLRYSNFRTLLTKRPLPFLNRPAQKSWNQLFPFLNLYQHSKNLVYSIYSFLRYSQFWSPVIRLPTPILDHARLINFLLAFIFCESLSTCKKSVYSICPFFRYILESRHMAGHTNF